MRILHSSTRAPEAVARQRLETLTPTLITMFARGERPEYKGLAAISKVACAILTSSRSTRQLASTAKPLTYLHRCVANALRHRPPRKEMLLLQGEAIDGDGTTVSGAAPRDPGCSPCDELLRRELSIVVAGLLHTLEQPKRACVTLWMQGFSYPQIARTLGISRAMVGYHVSSGLEKLRKQLRLRSWRFILTDFGPADSIPMSA
jgi:DNA-directed RNA polymerase specialized sigma24 family protein